MPLTKATAEHLAALMHDLRPEWDAHGNLRALEAVAGRNEFDVAAAAIRACADRTAETPGVLKSPNSPCWRERISENRTPRNPMPHEECGKHPGQFRLSCSGCFSEKHAPVLHEPVEPVSLDQVREKLRAEVAAYHAAVHAARDELNPKEGE